jgi:hypothetical protein
MPRNMRFCPATLARVRTGWPEADGPVDFQADEHEQLMLTLGWQSKRKITRINSGSAPQRPPKPATRAATSAVGHHPDIAVRAGERERLGERAESADVVAAGC